MPSCTVLREYFLVLEYGYCMHNFNDVQNILASTQNDVLSMHIMHITRVCIREYILSAPVRRHTFPLLESSTICSHLDIVTDYA